MEALAAAKCIAFDKTGTLTDNHIAVEEIKVTAEYSEEEILSYAASAELHSAHPIAVAIRAYADERNISIKELSDYTEISASGVSAHDGAHLITCGKAADTVGTAVTVDGRLIGVITVSERLRPEAKAVLDELSEEG